MDRNEIEEFLLEKWIAVLGTVRRDGTPHLIPMYYRKEGDSVLFFAARDSIKVKNIRKDNRVSILVAKDTSPRKGVRMEGTARIIESNVRDQALTIASRYEGLEKRTKLVDSPFGKSLIIIKVTPHRFYSWDYSKA